MVQSLLGLKAMKLLYRNIQKNLEKHDKINLLVNPEITLEELKEILVQEEKNKTKK